MKAFLLIFSGLLALGQAFAQDVVFLPRGSEKLFKATFDVSGTKMAGFLAAKHGNEGELFVEFTTPMGNNLITMKWENNRWKQEFAVKQLKNRFLMELLGEDLKYIFGYYTYSDEFIDFCDEWELGRMKLIPTFKKDQLHTLKVFDKQNNHERTIVYQYEKRAISKVAVEHPNMPYGLELEPIENN